MGIATIVGGVVGHAFLYATGMYGKIPGWYLSMAAVAFFERAAIRHGRKILPYSIGRFFSVVNLEPLNYPLHRLNNSPIRQQPKP